MGKDKCHQRQFFTTEDILLDSTSTFPEPEAEHNEANEVEFTEGSEEEASSEKENENKKTKGVEGIIEIQNPNLVKHKTALNARDIDIEKTTELSRREREEIEKQRSHDRYMKLQEQGKTEQARKNLERLALIRQQREEAAKKRAEDGSTPEAAKKREEEKAAREQNRKPLLKK
ncbi:PREDICTED: 28 kDa heat- and acid-stable phosphoprotein-like [Fragaria vesca subsp. vesca]|uniref:28 kDa heat- and acid-stable phosphoprotein-like n=1 Tax=Fragaria vesca subsp. vesca TaxID=101020 RepID=UPI0002C376D0|nr:PREDICTED: 28 kDa heat- and acid-stable phosphoprotein-like [Fragaria vesca subsp. vesca]